MIEDLGNNRVNAEVGESLRGIFSKREIYVTISVLANQIMVITQARETEDVKIAKQMTMVAICKLMVALPKDEMDQMAKSLQDDCGIVLGITEVRTSPNPTNLKEERVIH